MAETSIGPSNCFAGMRRTWASITPATALATSQNQPSAEVWNIEGPWFRVMPRETPSSHCTMKGSVITTSRMRAEWISAMVRASPPFSSPVITISTRPPGMPEKKAVIGS